MQLRHGKKLSIAGAAIGASAGRATERLAGNSGWDVGTVALPAVR
jgi:hypothetical protein